MPLASGTRLGPYEIGSPIGKGGMGEVYRARDTKLERDVAIKVLPGEFAEDAERLARFEREAKLLASLNHPNIASIYGLEESDGVKALVLELVEGPTLAERIAEGPIPVEEALAIAKQIAEALEAGHEAGVIHRDLKPANVKVKDNGTVKVLDYGLAKALEAPSGGDPSESPTLGTAVTGMGVIMGTAAYMSPEQARGKPVDRRADIWAFAVVVFEMLTGKRAFEAEDVSLTLAEVMKSEPQWQALPSGVSPVLRTFLGQCLRKDPTERVRDIGDVRLAIEGAFETAMTPAAETSRVTPRRTLPWVVATFILTAIAVAIAVWYLKPPEPKPVVRFVHDLPQDQRFAVFGSRLAIAPDGSRLVYSANGQLYLRNLNETTAQAIPGTEEGALSPAFSPDGEWIAYWADGQLKKIATGGGVPVLVARTVSFGFNWGEDDTIVYALEEGLMRVSANGGVPERLIDGGGIRRPRMLPGGETALFVLVDEHGAQIAVQSLASGERRVLFEGGKAHYVSTGHIVYARDGALFAVPFDRDALELTGGAVPLVEGVESGIGGQSQFEISDAGVLVYIAGGVVREQRVLGLTDRDGDVEMLNMPPAEYLSPRLSPDGKRVVVQTLDDDGVGTLWVYDLSGDRAMQQLTFEGDNRRPLWTRDGERITFASDRDGTMSIYWQPADGSGVAERLTTADESIEHLPSSWSPDGQVLAYMVQTGDNLAGDWDVWTLSLESNTVESLYDVPDTVHLGPEFSPDGRWLVYGSGDNPGEQDVYVEPFPPTGARRKISPSGGLWPMWSRAGAELFYRPVFWVSAPNSTALKVVDIVTEPDFAFSNERLLPLEHFVVVSYHRDYDITPDGEKLLMVFPANATESTAAPRQRIHVVLNWFEELKRLVPADH